MIKHAAVTFFLLLTINLFAQEDYGRFEISLSGAGAFSKKTEGNNVALTPTQAGGVVASLGMRLSPIASLDLNFGHVLNSQKFHTSTLDYRAQSTVAEISGSIMLRPFRGRKINPFFLAGAGALVFNPDQTFIDDTEQDFGADRQIRVGILYGAGIDYPLIPHISLRLQYRGLFYSPPDYKVPNLFTGGRGHMAEPTVGIAFQF